MRLLRAVDRIVMRAYLLQLGPVPCLLYSVTRSIVFPRSRLRRRGGRNSEVESVILAGAGERL
jgi:hypothetical protein